MAAPIAFLVPGDLAQLSGGYGYAREIIATWRAQGVDLDVIALPDDFPFPSDTSLAETADILFALGEAYTVLIDGLAFGAVPPAVIRRCKAPVTVLLHHPLGLETGLAADVAERLLASEKAALTLARQIVVTSAETGRTVEQLFDIPASSITVALPGTARQSPARRGNDPARIISVASITPRKGHIDLVEALARLADLPWTATFAGSLTASPETVTAAEAAIRAHGLQDRITLAGPLAGEDIAELYRSADIFALPSYYEGYGMAFAEALSFGLPIVGYRAGAVPDVVPNDAGILVEPGSVGDLANALRRLVSDHGIAEKMAASAHRAGLALPGWNETAATVLGALQKEPQR